MATYFHGSSEIQADGLQTLYLMNPNYIGGGGGGGGGGGYSDTQQPSPSSAANMLFLNATPNSMNPSNLQNIPLQNQHQHQQHFVGIPLPNMGPTNSDDQNRSSLHEIPSLQGLVPRFHYNLWGCSTDQNPTTGTHHQIPTSVAAAVTSGGAAANQLGLRRPVVSPTQQQGLSLSLSPHQPTYHHRSVPGEHDIQVRQQQPPPPVQAISPTSGGGGGDDIDMRVSGGSSSTASAVSNGISGMQGFLLGSKYLKAAQQLLDEVANVGKGIKTDSPDGTKERDKPNNTASVAASTGEAASGGETGSRRGADLSTAQRQELQMKKAKLVNMLDEVEQRYRQYHQQMQIVVSSFEQAAGQGSAKSYTALALQTISKQFRCLKDAISAQIKSTSSNLGEEDCSGGKVEGSRMRSVDHQLRQQRALQQLGMIQHNAWRPQRGLPERAVSVLRAWLFEHFLHPYPKDSDKHMLAKQTGLTRSQVSNWFINARVRLWKPMVEEMYLEEIKDHENNGSQENTSKSEANNKELGSKSQQESSGGVAGTRMDQTKDHHHRHLQSKQDKSIIQNPSPPELSNSTMSTSHMGGSLQVQAGFNLICSSEIEGMVQRSPKKPRSYEIQSSPSSILSMDMEMKPGGTSREMRQQPKDGYPLITGALNNSGGGFSGHAAAAAAAYSIGDISRFNPEQLAPRFHGNGVSLTLGLPHCENLSLSGNQQSYLSNPNVHLGRRLEMGNPEPDFCGINAAQPSHSNAGYESIDIQNRKRFAAQLLPDFVA